MFFSMKFFQVQSDIEEVRLVGKKLIIRTYEISSKISNNPSLYPPKIEGPYEGSHLGLSQTTRNL